MSEPLIEPAKSSPAQAFLDMGARILHNAGQAFGGAWVIIPPPVAGGAPMETLILDASQDPRQFYTLLKVKCDAAIGEIDAMARNQQSGAFGRR